MLSLSSNQQELVHDTLVQLHDAIVQLQEWNKDVPDMEILVHSELGMQRLAGNCMLIEAIGEGFKKVHKIAGEELFSLRPEIPWFAIMSMRNRIAHGYFDIDIEHINSVIQNDLSPLLQATDYLIEYWEKEYS
ncbi:MAG: DUF86 domain-containing protein [Paludibacteraceae bacterium]